VIEDRGTETTAITDAVKRIEAEFAAVKPELIAKQRVIAASELVDDGRGNPMQP
jgi:hypothetical protein